MYNSEELIETDLGTVFKKGFQSEIEAYRIKDWNKTNNPLQALTIYGHEIMFVTIYPDGQIGVILKDKGGFMVKCKQLTRRS